MSKEVKVICDGCGKDITSTGGIPDFRLHLESQKLPHSSNIIAAVLVYPDIEEDCYFCNLQCLERWLTKRAPDSPSAVGTDSESTESASG
jgi:hypothetical protein